MKNNERAKALFRLALMLIPIINGILATYGMSPLPFEATEIEALVSLLAGIVFGVIGWWKNNNITEDAQIAQEVLKELKQQKKE